MANGDFIPEDQVAPAAPAPAATAATPDFIPEDQALVQGTGGESATPIPAISNAIKGALGERWGTPWDVGPQGADFRSKVGAVASGALQGNIPFSKDLGAGAVAGLNKLGLSQPGMPTNYTDARAALDQNIAALKAQHPGYALAGTLAGAGALSPLMPAASVGQAMGSGAVYGGLTGAGEGGTLGQRAWNAMLGAGEGLVGGAVGGILGAPFRARSPEVRAAIDAAGRQGINIPRGVVGSPATQAVTSGLSQTPIGGAIPEAIGEAVGQTGARIQQQAGTIGGATKASAANFAVPAIRDWADQGFTQSAQRIFRPLGNLNASSQLGDLPATRVAAQQIMNQAAGKDAAKEITPAVQDVLDAATRPSGLTFAQMNGLKQELGRSANWDARGDQEGFKRLYGALNDDVRAHAQAVGGNQGLVAFDRANTQFQGLLDQAAGVRKLLGTGSDESVVDRFTTKAFDNVGGQGKGGDLDTLAKVKQSIPEPAYNELVSSMVGNFGVKQDGSTDLTKFLGDWSKMSPNAKDQVFSTPGTAVVRKNLDDIAQVATVLKKSKPSGSSELGGSLAGYEGLAEIVKSLAKGEVLKAGAIAAGAGAGKVAANHLASPVGSGIIGTVARAYGQVARTPSSEAITNFRAVLGRAGAILGGQANQSIQSQ